MLSGLMGGGGGGGIMGMIQKFMPMIQGLMGGGDKGGGGGGGGGDPLGMMKDLFTKALGGGIPGMTGGLDGK
jgi:hypothetical protein